MNWSQLLRRWEPVWVVETMAYLPPALVSEALAGLGPDCHPSQAAREAVERLR